uniref:Cytochrome b5 heme-binding domain-containing protein n=2 Tax=Hemiselmis andersenii TaxID=464988 RepID=A0A6T8JZ40_HEMAN|mmetsp:Transcript_23087/g.53120  ORF Transcript_23087/g.53120 Transcript_23087/m.53120 type:complete len:159 (+) Transcript_23087:259-735(+)
MAEQGADDGRVRRKMDTGEGRSLVHWSRLKPKVKRIGKIKLSEVAKHKTKEDCWTAFRGLVYDMTPFFEYHPGGQKYLMMTAGKDGTKLFNKYHQWVNIEFLMEKCLIGKLVGEDGQDLTDEQILEEGEEEEEEEGDTGEMDAFEKMALENAKKNAKA